MHNATMWVFMSPWHLYVEIKPQGKVFGGMVFGCWLELEGRTLVDGISALKKVPQGTLIPFSHVRIQWEDY